MNSKIKMNSILLNEEWWSILRPLAPSKACYLFYSWMPQDNCLIMREYSDTSMFYNMLQPTNYFIFLAVMRFSLVPLNLLQYFLCPEISFNYGVLLKQNENKLRTNFHLFGYCVTQRILCPQVTSDSTSALFVPDLSLHHSPSWRTEPQSLLLGKQLASDCRFWSTVKG